MPSGYFWDQLDAQQKSAVEFAQRRKTVGLFAEQGTGKTWITLALVESLVATSPAFCGIVVCQKNNKETTWRKLLPHLQLTATSDWKEFKKIRGPRLLLAHYEEMGKLISKLQRFGRSHGWSMIAIDECQRLKARGNVSSRWAARLDAEHKLGLSGTPFEQTPTDAWAQFRFINPQVFGKKWATFKHRYTYASGWMGKKRVFREDRLGRFLKAIQPWCLRITKEALDLPPYRIIKHRLSLPPEALEVYLAMRDRQIVRIPYTEKIRAPLTITRDAKLAQICGGFILGDLGYYWLHDTKLTRCAGIIRDSHHPVVVFCRFMPEITELKRWLEQNTELHVDTYTGRTKDKPAVQDKFQAGGTDVLICQVRAGGVGIDLFNARTVIVYSAEWSSISFDQLISRVHRRGQVNRVRIHLLIVRSSIDMKIHLRIKSKLRKINPILNRLESKSHDRIQRR